MLDDRADDPRDRRDDREEHDQRGHAAQSLAHGSHSDQFGVVVIKLPATEVPVLRKEVARVVGDLRVLREKCGQQRVGFQVGLIRQKRRVKSQHLAKRRRELLQQLMQALLGLRGVDVVVGKPISPQRRLRDPGRLRGALSPRCCGPRAFLGENGGGGQGQQQGSGEGTFHIPLTTCLAPAG